jgi:hypothetical protein
VRSFLWWMKNALLGVGSLLFLTFGIINLGNSYELKNPFEFVMTFFSASLMIMISIVGIVYPVLQIYFFLKKDEAKTNEHNL